MNLVCEECGCDIVFDLNKGIIDIMEINKEYCVIYVDCSCGEGWLVQYDFVEMVHDG